MTDWISIDDEKPPIKETLLLTDGKIIALGLYPTSFSYFVGGNVQLTEVKWWMPLPSIEGLMFDDEIRNLAEKTEETR